MKVAILVPHHGDVKAKFAASLAGLTGRTMAGNGPGLAVIFEEDGPLELKRTRLVIKARRWGADYVLFVDSDQIFPPDALVQLLARQQPVVGCNYMKRDGKGPTAIDQNSQRVWTTEKKAKAGLLEEVAALGLGFCLIHKAVFEKIGDVLLFQSTITPAGEFERGEDVHFFNLVRKAGFPVLLDHAVSWGIGHIGETIRANEGEDFYVGSAALAAGGQ
jgi:hypothetical protein